MSALLRQFFKRGVALNVLCSQHLNKLPSTGLMASRFLSSSTKEPSNAPDDIASIKDEFISDVKPKIEKSVYDKLVRTNKVVVFMKGTPRSPRCGFSNAVVQIFRMHGVEYDAHDVLADEDIREGIKRYTDWPTIPQVFINGEFVGGCDILLEMHQSGELIEKLEKIGITSHLLKLQREHAAKESKAYRGGNNNNKQ